MHAGKYRNIYPTHEREKFLRSFFDTIGSVQAKSATSELGNAGRMSRVQIEVV